MWSPCTPTGRAIPFSLRPAGARLLRIRGGLSLKRIRSVFCTGTSSPVLLAESSSLAERESKPDVRGSTEAMNESSIISERLLTLKEMAEYLQISRRSLRELCVRRRESHHSRLD